MLVKQISAFVENKSGRLAEITRILANNEIDIRAITISDTTDFGILRLVVNDPDKAVKILTESFVTATITEVIAVVLSDKIGYLSRLLDVLKEHNIGVEYIYSCIVNYHDNVPIIVIKTNDGAKAADVLKMADYDVLSPERLYSL